MNDDDFNSIVIELSDTLELDTLMYLNKKFSKEEDSNFILNIVLSVHISSLVNIMRSVSREDVSVSKNVDNFVKDLIGFVEHRLKVQISKYQRQH